MSEGKEASTMGDLYRNKPKSDETNPMVQKDLFNETQKKTIDDLKKGIVQKIENILTTQSEDYEISIRRQMQLKDAIGSYTALKKIYEDFRTEANKAHTEEKNKISALEQAKKEETDRANTAEEAKTKAEAETAAETTRANTAEAEKAAETTRANAAEEAQAKAEQEKQEAEAKGSTEATEKAFVALKDFGDEIQGKLDELNKESNEAQQKAEATVSKEDSLVGDWLKSRLGYDVKKEREDKKREATIKALKESMNKTTDLAKERQIKAAIARNQMNEIEKDTKFIESLEGELTTFNSELDTYKNRNAEGNTPSGMTKRAIASENKKNKGVKDSIGSTDNSGLTYGEKGKTDLIRQVNEEYSPQDIKDELKHWLEQGESVPENNQGAKQMLLNKINGSNTFPENSQMSTNIIGGKGRKTKRRKFMGGKTKKRTKGRKRRTTKK
jgi:hypothetical protein